MDEATKQRIAERIAERKRLGLDAGAFDAHVSQQISDASYAMHLQVALSFKNTFNAVRNGNDPVAAQEYRKRADGNIHASAAAEQQRLAAVEYAKKFGVISK